eukprot:TRINITY_DN7399_c0_g1_i1.p1 TRINITY_DN7399_c0_g1~~TRINITY_DN7399_c0_g1_i1.p1  ORF type:complete len:629 (+),score=139.20 TRINITY_DN7399_c0_g1_i1:1610-3496(+)
MTDQQSEETSSKATERSCPKGASLLLVAGEPRGKLLDSSSILQLVPRRNFVFHLNDHPVVQSQEPYIDAHHLLPIARISRIPDSIQLRPTLLSTPSYEHSVIAQPRMTRSKSVEELDQKLNDSCYECPPSHRPDGAVVIDIHLSNPQELMQHPEHSLHLAAHDRSVHSSDEEDGHDSEDHSPLLEATHQGPVLAQAQFRRRMPSKLNQDAKRHREGSLGMNIGDDEVVRRLSACLEKDPKAKFDVVLVNSQGETLNFKRTADLFEYLEKSVGLKASNKQAASPGAVPQAAPNVSQPVLVAGNSFTASKIFDENYNSNVMWIDVEGAQVPEIENLGKKFELHPLTIEDCCASGGRQKLEPFENYLFLVLKSLHHDYYSWDIDNPIKILVFSNVVLTFHRYPSFAIHIAMQRVLKLHKSNYLKVVESTHILHTVADSICDTDVPVVNTVEDETDLLEEQIYGENTIDDDQDLLQRIGLTKRRLTRFRQLLWPKRDIILSLVQREYLDTLRSKINVAYFRDVYDHLVLMVQQLEVDHETVSTLEATHLARVSIEMAKTANSMNHVMKKFSSVATIILPLSFITSLMGMNVPIPYQSGVDDFSSLTPFTVMSVVMISFAIFLVVWFRRKGWL